MRPKQRADEGDRRALRRKQHQQRRRDSSRQAGVADDTIASLRFDRSVHRGEMLGVAAFRGLSLW
jgi:hypothetical protein